MIGITKHKNPDSKEITFFNLELTASVVSILMLHHEN